LSGSQVFFNLTKTVSSADTLKFAWNATQSVSGALVLRGTAGNLLTLRSTKAGTKAGLLLDGDSGTQTIDYLNVADSDATGGAFLLCLTASEGCINGGNTVHWEFGGQTVSFALGSSTAEETASGTTIIVSLSGASLLPVTVPITVSGTATGTGADFTLINHSVRFAPGVTATGVLVRFVDDSEVEEDETIVLTMGTPTNASLGAVTTHTITLTSEDTRSGGGGGAAKVRRARLFAQQNTGGGGGGTSSTAPAAFVPDYAPLAQARQQAQDQARRGASGSLLPDPRRIGDIRDALVARFRDQMELARRHEEEQRAARKAFLAQDARATPDARRFARAQELARLQTASLPRSAPAKVAERRGLLLAVLGTQEVVYRDVPIDAWFAPYVSFLIEEDIATGYKDTEDRPTGEFGVHNAVTRAEVLKMALQTAHVDLTTMDGSPRNQSAKGTWAAPYVRYAETAGFSLFVPSLNVHAPMTRGAVITTILEAAKLPLVPKPISSFADLPSNHPYARALSTAIMYGLIEGDTDTLGLPLHTVRPDDRMNRAEASKVISLMRGVVR
jgi:hypothetical protein